MNFESLGHLQASLARIDGLIRAAVIRAQEDEPTDALQGLIITPEEVSAHLNSPPLGAVHPPDALPEVSLDPQSEIPDEPFLRLVRIFNLNAFDAHILLLALAPELDRRYERLYGFLQDDVSKKYPTVNLMMNLLGATPAERFVVWDRLSPEKPLRKHHLIIATNESNNAQTPFIGQVLRVDHRLIAHLLGDPTPDTRLQYTVRLSTAEPLPALPEEKLQPLRAALKDSPLLYLHGEPDMGQQETAAALCADYQIPMLVVDVAALLALAIPAETVWRLVFREGYLMGAALYLEGWEAALDDQHKPHPALWELLNTFPIPVFMRGAEAWESTAPNRKRRLLRVRFEVPDFDTRLQAWQTFTQAEDMRLASDTLVELASKFRFTRKQIARAVSSAADIAISRGKRAEKADLYAGAQAHSGLRLGHLARRITPRYRWEDLILPPEQLAQLHEITARARYAHIIRDDWGFGRKISRVNGVSALFAGDSGTGKTLSAEVIAQELGLVLYKIDLSAVVSKYIGETEKNLSIIFSEARSSNAILFFDEADALFGKRSEVKDARDRYANIEIAYLLQQIEEYDGIAILATNLRQNLDEAFTRRLDFMIDFPFPESEYRERIWQAHFPDDAPLGQDVQLEEVASRYHLAGGNIRNAAIAAAYLAAADGGQITMQHIRSAIRREHQKMGRLLEDVY